MLTIKQRGPTIYPQFITKQKYLPELANVGGDTTRGKRREARTRPVEQDGRHNKGAPLHDSSERDRREDGKEAGEKAKRKE